MADTPASTTPNPKLAALMDLLRQPWVGQCAVLLITFMTGAGSLALTQHFRATEVSKAGLRAADAPTPVACAENFHALETKGDLVVKSLAELRARIDAQFPSPPEPRVAPSKTRVLK